MTRERRLFRLLLRLYPAAFRDEYGAEMAWVFVQQLAAARSAGPTAVASLWLRTIADAVTHGLQERAVAEPAAKTAGGPGLMLAATNPPGSRLRRAAVSPLGIPPLMVVLGLGRLVFAEPPDIVGVPFGLILWAAALVWASLGAVVVLRTRDRTTAAAAIALFTLPALALQLLTPALIGWVMQLGSTNLG